MASSGVFLRPFEGKQKHRIYAAKAPGRQIVRGLFLRSSALPPSAARASRRVSATRSPGAVGAGCSYPARSAPSGKTGHHGRDPRRPARARRRRARRREHVAPRHGPDGPRQRRLNRPGRRALVSARPQRCREDRHPAPRGRDRLPHHGHGRGPRRPPRPRRRPGTAGPHRPRLHLAARPAGTARPRRGPSPGTPARSSRCGGSTATTSASAPARCSPSSGSRSRPTGRTA